MKINRVTICGVPFSDNLGDGAIADCLKAFFEQERGMEVTLCDISYRESINSPSLGRYKMSVFQRFPGFVRQWLVLVLFTLKFLRGGRQYLRSRMSHADVCIIGGGQLVSDVDLNFPLKLYFVVRTAELLNIPVRILSVGVSGRWSFLGKKLMSRVLRSRAVTSIVVRDQRSQDNLKAFFGLEAGILPDPALLASVYFGNLATEKRGTFHRPQGLKIGVGVSDLVGLNYSSDVANRHDQNQLIHWRSILDALKGFDVELFTNGAYEDEAFLHSILVPFLSHHHCQFSVSPRCKSSQELIALIAGFDKIIAFRLHAIILASSFNRFHLGVVWDTKVKSFFQARGNEQYAFSSLAALSDWLIAEDLSQFQLSWSKDEIRTAYMEYCDQFSER